MVRTILRTAIAHRIAIKCPDVLLKKSNILIHTYNSI